MRICYTADAGSIHTQRWVNYFAQRGHEVHLISTRAGEGYSKHVRFHLLTTLLSRPSLISGYINALVWVIQTRGLIRRIKPDVIDAHYITICGYLAIISGFHPAVLTVLGSDVLLIHKQKHIYRFLTPYSLKKADLVICDSETVRKRLVELGTNPARIKMVYNGIDTKQFSPHHNKAKGTSDSPTIISTRNLRPVYNVEMLIKAIPTILKQEPRATFVIVGDGDQRDYLTSLASSLGVLNSVQFIGWISHDELPDYLASSEIYVSTSLSDSTSLSLQEAMACESAPVVTDLPANREWLKDGENGFLVPVNDVQTLADKIIYLINDEETRKRFGTAGRKIIKQRAEYEKEMSKMEKLYQQLVKK